MMFGYQCVGQEYPTLDIGPGTNKYGSFVCEDVWMDSGHEIGLSAQASLYYGLMNQKGHVVPCCIKYFNLLKLSREWDMTGRDQAILRDYLCTDAKEFNEYIHNDNVITLISKKSYGLFKVTSNTATNVLRQIVYWFDITKKSEAIGIKSLLPLWHVVLNISEGTLYATMPYFDRGCILDIAVPTRAVNYTTILSGGVKAIYAAYECLEICNMLKNMVLDITEKMRYIHRDIKPQNLYLTDIDSLILGDMDGVVPSIVEHGLYHGWKGGTRAFSTPPEAYFEESKFCGGWDAWAIGTTLFALLYNVQPFTGSCEDDVTQNIKNCEFVFLDSKQYKDVYTSLGSPPVCVCGRMDGSVCCGIKSEKEGEKEEDTCCRCVIDVKKIKDTIMKLLIQDSEQRWHNLFNLVI